MTRNWLWRGATSLLAGALALSACGTSQGGGGNDAKNTVILIGDIVSKSGTYTVGQPSDDTLEIAVKEINDAGGIEVGGTRYTFKIEQRDDRSDPAATASAARELLAEGAKIMFGPIHSGALGVIQQTDPAKVIYVTASSGAAGQLNQPGDHYLLTSLPAMDQRITSVAEAFAKFAPNARKVVVMGPDDSIMAELVASFNKIWPGTGGSVDTVLYPAGTTDLATYLAKVRSLNPEVLYIGENPTTVKTALQQLNAAGISKHVVIGAHGSEPGLAAEASGRAVLAAPFSSGPLSGDGVLPAAAKLTDKYLAATKQTKLPSYSAPLLWYYDHFNIIANAMVRAGTIDDADAILEKIRGTTHLGYDGVNGPVRFDKKGFVQYPLLNTWVATDGTQTRDLWQPTS